MAWEERSVPELAERAAAPGGIGAGTQGLVSSTLGIGSPIASFDPIITGTLQMDRDHLLSSSAFNWRAGHQSEHRNGQLLIQPRICFGYESFGGLQQYVT